MPLDLTWQEMLLRLLWTVVASAAIGFNRGERGHAAGLRTTILVGLAAAVAMIQMNLLLPVDGKTGGSFSVMDIMRLPLGILTGVGFIGGGTILKRGDLVTGVTTAATLWIVTVIGLCFGGGQIWLGVAATAISVATLWPLRWWDRRIERQHRAEITVAIAPKDQETLRELPRRLAALGYGAQLRRVAIATDEQVICFDVSWRRAETAGPPIDLIVSLQQNYKLRTFRNTSEAQH